MAKRKPLEVEEVTEQQPESEAPSGLSLEIGLVLVTSIALIVSLVLGWLELQKFQGA